MATSYSTWQARTRGAKGMGWTARKRRAGAKVATAKRRGDSRAYQAAMTARGQGAGKVR